jgi:copper resistance protein D
MSAGHQVLVFIHLLAAFVWVGGLFFLALVGAPVLRREAPPEVRAALFRAVGLRFRWVGWGALAILLATGTWILHLSGLLRWELLGDGAWWGTPVGRALAWKLTAVAVMVGLTAAHDWKEGRVRSRASLPPAPPSPGRRAATLLARGSAVVALIVVYWAMRLARGG